MRGGGGAQTLALHLIHGQSTVSLPACTALDTVKQIAASASTEMINRGFV